MKPSARVLECTPLSSNFSLEWLYLSMISFSMTAIELFRIDLSSSREITFSIKFYAHFNKDFSLKSNNRTKKKKPIKM